MAMMGIPLYTAKRCKNIVELTSACPFLLKGLFKKVTNRFSGKMSTFDARTNKSCCKKHKLSKFGQAFVKLTISSGGGNGLISNRLATTKKMNRL